MPTTRSLLPLFLLAFVTTTGCGSSSSDPPTAAVSGTVYLDGAPAADVEVNFISEGYSAFGRTDEQGRYELVAGAAIGENKVYFSKVQGLQFPINPAQGMDEGQVMAMQDPGVPSSLRPKQVIPQEYSDPTQTKVSFIVPDGGASEADFKLSSR